MSFASTGLMLLEDPPKTGTTTPAPTTTNPVPAPQPTVTTKPVMGTVQDSYTPKNPALAMPTLGDTKSNLGQTPTPESFVDPKTATVEGRTTNLMSAPNELLRAAQAVSDDAYNAKGLLMSGGAVRAGTGAMIDKALQIATPDAALYGNMAQTGYKAKTDSLLNNQLADIERMKSANNATITGALTQQEVGGKIEMQRMIDNAQAQRLEIDAQWKNALNMDALDMETQKTLSGVAATMGAELMGSIERILRDPGIEDKTPAIDVMMQKYRSNVTTVGNVLGIPLTWS